MKCECKLIRVLSARMRYEDACGNRNVPSLKRSRNDLLLQVGA